MAFGIREHLPALNSSLFSAFSNLLVFVKTFCQVTKCKAVQMTAMVLCICSTAQCKLVLFFVFFQKKVLSKSDYRGGLVANVGHCLFFTKTKLHMEKAFLALCYKEI